MQASEGSLPPLLLGEGHRSDCFPARTPQEDAKNAGKISSRMIGHPQMRDQFSFSLGNVARLRQVDDCALLWKTTNFNTGFGG